MSNLNNNNHQEALKDHCMMIGSKVRSSPAINNVDKQHQSNHDIGILAIATYFPKSYVNQQDLELYDKVEPGKYTIGLMQDKMAFCTDLEDINSIALTVTRNLLVKTGVKLSDIGYLEVGTETILDKSKSIKTVLMQLFEESGNTDIEGVDTINACYGGTAALFHAIDHCASPFWDGRLAIVVAADIAVYDKGSARPTGGCGAVAMLIGPNAPLVFDSYRATQMTNTYDFYKPDPTSEYPIVDGKLSLQAYITALDRCMELYRLKNARNNSENNNPVLMDQFDAILFHSPYCKLVRKAFARFMFNDYRRLLSNSGKKLSGDRICYNRQDGSNKLMECILSYGQPDASMSKYKDWIKPIGPNTTLEKVAIKMSDQLFRDKTEASLYLSNQLGNMYTASLYACLISYLTSRPVEELANNRLLFFSYGSGSAASMFSARLKNDVQALNKLLIGIGDVRSKLSDRVQVSPDEFSAHLEHKRKTFCSANRCPTGLPTTSIINGCMNGTSDDKVDFDKYLYPDTYYLTSIDAMFRRQYSLYEIDGVVVEAKHVTSNGH